jgi:hypothetical protein
MVVVRHLSLPLRCLKQDVIRGLDPRIHPISIEVVILRRSPFFTASLEGCGHERKRPSFETPRKSAAPQSL